MTAALCLLTVGFFLKVSANRADGSTDKARREFISGIGFKAGNAVEKEIIIPTEFSETYLKYNEIQKSAGFDLSAYKGCRVKLYIFSQAAYPECSEEMRLNMIVYKGKIIGGDISSVSSDGQRLPLKRVNNIRRENGKAETG